MFINFEGCSEVLMISFLFFPLPNVYWSCNHLLTYIILIFLIYIYIYIYVYMYVCIFTNLSMCCFFSIFIHMFLYVCNPSFLFHTRCLNEFCLSVSERQVVKVYHAMNSLLAKFIKILC